MESGGLVTDQETLRRLTNVLERRNAARGRSCFVGGSCHVNVDAQVDVVVDVVVA